MATDIEICNRALSRIGQDSILALDTSSKRSRACLREYAECRDKLLRTYIWTFAIKRAPLPKQVAAPAFGFANAFARMPDDLRLVSLDPEDAVYRLEGRNILTDEGSLSARYVSRVTDENVMDPNFRAALVYEVAQAICIELTQDKELRQQILNDLDTAISHARSIHAIEDFPQAVEEGDWISSRY